MEIMSTNQFAVSFNADREALSYLLVWPQTFQRYVGSSQACSKLKVVLLKGRNTKSLLLHPSTRVVDK